MKVKAYIGSQIAHVSQVFTGLAMLQKAGRIDLSFEKDSVLGKNTAIQQVSSDGRVLIFDLADGFQINPTHYASCDLYFKRMLDPDSIGLYDKIRPYGLNYPVNIVGDGLLQRSWMSGDRKLFLNNILRRSLWLSKLFNINFAYSTSQVRHFEGKPGVHPKPKVIYFTRLWDPSRVKDEKLKEQRETMNTMRRDLVLALRREFKDQFTGGIYRTEFSAAFAPEATTANNDALHKTAYLKNLRASDIGIADYGLEMSVGFKLAEYVAMSKTIVSTPINTVLPGYFSEGRNYLPYTNLVDCVQQCSILIRNPQLILEMQRCNEAYYQEFLKPDQLIWNCLTTR